MERMRLNSIIYKRVLERCRNIAFDRAETAEQRRAAARQALRISTFVHAQLLAPDNY